MAELHICRCDACGKEEALGSIAPPVLFPAGWFWVAPTQTERAQPGAVWHFCSWACVANYAAKQFCVTWSAT